jgi:hypothetical protein
VSEGRKSHKEARTPHTHVGGQASDRGELRCVGVLQRHDATFRSRDARNKRLDRRDAAGQPGDLRLQQRAQRRLVVVEQSHRDVVRDQVGLDLDVVAAQAADGQRLLADQAVEDRQVVGLRQ